MASPADALKRTLERTLLADERRLAVRIARARDTKAGEAAWQKLAADVEAAVGRYEARLARRPALAYPPELPVSQRADDIAAAIVRHRVVIVCGETGSGKTTQLPKICLQAGRGIRGLIGHTQPRRIAARAVATRIAQEMGSPLGEAVGFKVRFTDQTKPDAFVKLMTDGILLAETQRDRLLAAYDTIIVDEAHERSLNIDFLLGYLRQLLAKRPDLKVIVTSATLDAARFAAHFGEPGRPAPVIEVSGRTYPVEVRYRPLGATDDVAGEADDEEAMEDAIAAAAEDLWREGPGDILAFLPGEREIRETGDLLRRSLARRPYAAHVEILPLFARLSVQEQQRVFAPSKGRRIVLATNVAETSLTVPGIRYVIDTGLARVKRYNVRNKTTLLGIEKIARSAANQRAGRCGRVQEGICVRLYAEDDFASRPAYTDPEILRSSLASVILRMTALDLGAVEAFPFLDPPTPRAVADGYQLLQELDAVDGSRQLTPAGRELARLPLDPRIGRIVLAARDGGCLPEALVIASALAVPDPRERPLDKQQAADQAHLRFRDERSDFLSLVALWEFFEDALAQKLSHRKLVDACRAQFVNQLRMREWRDVHQQLATELADAGWKWAPALPPAFDAARYAALHAALLAGLLANVGQKAEEGGYEGTRGLRFHLHPGSGLAKKPPRWVLAAELVETSRLFARVAARVEPEWIEAVAGDRVTRDWFEPHWDEKRGEVVASERVQLYGLTLVPRRLRSFGAIDPVVAREVFIREALVPGALATRGAFVAHNAKLVGEIAELEHKARRQDVLVDPESMAAFYAERLPQDVHSLAGFERWREAAERRDPRVLHFTRDALMRHAAVSVTEALFPDAFEMAGTRLPLKYRFAPGHPLDGLTLSVPLALLNQLDDARLTWLVPGLIREKVTWYFKALPKALRNRLVPVPDRVTAFLEATPAGREPLADAIRGWMKATLGESPPVDAWDGLALPPHLAINVRVIDAAGRELGSGRDLAALRGQLGQAAQMTFAAGGAAFERKGLRGWDVGDLPETLTMARKGQRVTGYPALVDDGDSVSLTLLDTAEGAEASTRAAVVRLIGFALREALARYERGPPGFTQSALMLKSVVPADRLLADVMDAVRDRAFVGDDPLPRSEKAFAEQVRRARTRLPAVAEGAFRLLAAIAAAHQTLTQRLAALPGAHARFAADLRAQRDALVYPGFFGETPWTSLQHLPRYLEGLERRLAKYLERPERDHRHAQQVADLWRRYRERVERNRSAGRREPALVEYRWLLEELKVSLFAQELKTPFPVSFKRVEKAWSDLGA
ncbi:MAG TPA: ATP-dependent RNA helicase HrpA [Casimicrobiaceae bacterium]|nr:ATP-dependent RNA helicase HrpA [Casimicrobiaceae bacterium]